jgi:hypothetical protein
MTSVFLSLYLFLPVVLGLLKLLEVLELCLPQRKPGKYLAGCHIFTSCKTAGATLKEIGMGTGVSSADNSRTDGSTVT